MARLFAAGVLCLALCCPLGSQDAAVTAKAQSLTGEGGCLTLFRNEEESLAVSGTKDNRVFISRAGDKAVRRVYDDEGRLSKREEWSVPNKARTKVEVYSYNEDGTSRRVTDEGAGEERTRTECDFDSGGRVTEERQWKIIEASGEGGKTAASGGEEKHLIKVIKTKYGTDGKTAEVTTAVRGEDGKKKVVREVYDGDDTYRYENGVLRSSVVHKTEDDYTQTVVFGEGESKVMIVTEYKGAKKVNTLVVK